MLTSTFVTFAPFYWSPSRLSFFATARHIISESQIVARTTRRRGRRKHGHAAAAQSVPPARHQRYSHRNDLAVGVHLLHGFCAHVRNDLHIGYSWLGVVAVLLGHGGIRSALEQCRRGEALDFCSHHEWQIGVLSTGYFILLYMTVFASQAVFQPLFVATQNWFRGFVFLVTATISLMTIPLVIGMSILDRRDRKLMDAGEESRALLEEDKLESETMAAVARTPLPIIMSEGMDE